MNLEPTKVRNNKVRNIDCIEKCLILLDAASRTSSAMFVSEPLYPSFITFRVLVVPFEDVLRLLVVVVVVGFLLVVDVVVDTAPAVTIELIHGMN